MAQTDSTTVITHIKDNIKLQIVQKMILKRRVWERQMALINILPKKLTAAT